MKSAPTITLVSTMDHGHRGPFVALFSSIFPSRLVRHWRQTIADPNPALFLMVEESPAGYLLASVVRALLRRPTVGLLFRPMPVLRTNTIRLRLKSAALRLLKRISRITTLTIVPFYVEPRFRQLADGWIHDPQLWDLTADDHGFVEHAEHPIASSIRAAAAGRKTILALGRQDEEKGFRAFATLYAQHKALRDAALFAYAGKVGTALAATATRFAKSGGWAADRFVSHHEMLAAYAAADFVWCAYPPGYDQASGIFGRAVQLGITPIVREGSLIHRQCLADAIPHLAITDANAVEQLLAAPVSRSNGDRSLAERWKRSALATLARALEIDVPA